MMTDKQLIARLLEMQEHPEQATDEQLRQVLNDEQMHELVEQMAFTKRAFKNEETQTQELPIADEWEKFATTHAEELTNAARAEGKFTLHFPTHKIAASFIGVLLVSGMAFAAIHIVRQYQKQEAPQTEMTENMTSPVTTLPADTLTKDTVTVQPVIYNNIPLEKMLPEIAAHYGVKVKFAKEEACGLRFRFVWNPQQGIDQVVNDLNQFERLTVTLKDNLITVE